MNKVGIGTRVLNFLVDTAIVFALSYILNRVQNWYGYYYEFRTWNFGWAFAAVTVVYYTLLEGFWGRTPGKKLSFSKVVTKTGKKPGLLLAFVRSLVRLTVIDLFFLPFTERTLHDIVTGTEVVEI
jgi:uncharacterized RDD family membrane protein YckC